MNTADTLRAVIARELEVDASTLAGDATFESLGVDSLSLVEMLFAIEDEFGIKIPPAAAENIHCINDLNTLIDDLQSPALATSLAA
jgi:acyl carrier protein